MTEEVKIEGVVAISPAPSDTAATQKAADDITKSISDHVATIDKATPTALTENDLKKITDAKIEAENRKLIEKAEAEAENIRWRNRRTMAYMCLSTIILSKVWVMAVITFGDDTALQRFKNAEAFLSNLDYTLIVIVAAYFGLSTWQNIQSGKR